MYVEGEPTLPGETCKTAPLDKWTPQEKWVWVQVCEGKTADLNEFEDSSGNINIDPKNSKEWDESRVLTPEFLETILLHEPYRGALTRHGVRIQGAWLREPLDLSNASLVCQLGLNASRFDKDIALEGLKTAYLLSLAGSKFTGRLDMDRIEVGEGFYMSRAEFEEVNLRGAKIGGDISMISSRFTGKLNMSSMAVESNFFMRYGAEFREVNLRGAKIGGQIDMTGSKFTGRLYMDKMEVRQSLFMRDGAEFSGVNLRGAKIGGQIDMTGSKFTGGLDMDRIEVGEGFYMSRAEFEEVNLGGAKIGGQIDMTGSQLYGKANFGNARFSGKAIFVKTAFKSDTVFDDAIFQGEADFRSASISNYNYFIPLVGNKNVLFSEEQRKRIIEATPQPSDIKWNLINTIEKIVKFTSVSVKIILISAFFVAFSIFALFYLIRLLRLRKKNRIIKTLNENEGIEAVVVNDAAIASYDRDLLGTSELAKGLSLFLSNKNTIPPITLAITGKWGSGKSSLMGMLKEYLKDARYCPIWFNAWHHYKEEHMFGALLESVRQEAIPPIWRPSGLSFRLRLLVRRAWRHPLATILIISIVLFFASFSFISESSFSELLKELHVSNKKLFSASIITVLLGSIAVLAKGLAAFGLNPNLLFRKMSRSVKDIGVNADPGLRYRINQYLDDITWAMSKRTLVIFIDDLDRCPPDQVLRVMEYANFLSSNPRRSFIVLGMDLDKVLPSISKEFDYIVEEALEEEEEGERESQRNRRLKKSRLEYAKNYLKKMINIEIHVPEASVEKLEKIANPKINYNKQHENTQGKSNRLISIIDQRFFPVLFLAFILLGIFASGYYTAGSYDKRVKDSKGNVNISEEDSDTDGSAGRAVSRKVTNKEDLTKEEISGNVSDMEGSTEGGASGQVSIAGEDSVDREDISRPDEIFWRNILASLGGVLGLLLAGLLLARYFLSKKTVIKDDPVFF